MPSQPRTLPVVLPGVDMVYANYKNALATSLRKHLFRSVISTSRYGGSGLHLGTQTALALGWWLSILSSGRRDTEADPQGPNSRPIRWIPEMSTVSELESSMSSSVQIEQKTYEMPPREGISIAHFLTVADIERSARFYEKVFGARILSLGDGNAPGYLQLANIWMILNIGGGPTPDKPTVTLSVPDPNHINSFMNFRVADIQACYELWKSRGAEFITEPIPKYGETRCYIRDPDGYIIEVGQSTTLTYG